MRLTIIAVAIGCSAVAIASSPVAALASGSSTTRAMAASSTTGTTSPAQAISTTAVVPTTGSPTTTSIPSAPAARMPGASMLHAVRGAAVSAGARTRPGANPRVSNVGVTISSHCAGFCFVPADTTIVVGDSITWHDTTGTEHIIARCRPSDCNGASGGSGGDAGFTAASLTIAAGGTGRFTFDRPGTYVYYCTIHGYAAMHGTIIVTAATPTTVPSTTLAPTGPGATAPTGPQLAHTGSGTNGTAAVAGLLVVLGLAAASFRLRRRYS